LRVCNYDLLDANLGEPNSEMKNGSGRATFDRMLKYY